MAYDTPIPTGQGKAIPLMEPAALARIGKLELVARQIMDGYVQGMHRSPHIGFAVDFAQHRQYVPGDDIKRIDWRVYGKANRYYIKQYEVTTNLRAYILVDCSGSMAYQGQNEPLSKFRYSQYLAVALSYLVLHQQDSVGLLTLEQSIRTFLPPRSAPSHFVNIARSLDACQTGREASLAPVLHEVAERIQRRSMVILISDLFDDAEKLIEAFHHFRHRRHEVILLQVMADDEMIFPFSRWTRFDSLERPTDTLRLDPALMRQRYLENVSRHIARLRQAADSLRLSYAVLNTSQSFDQALTLYLANRMSERR